jgi:hypothetical protein
VLDYDRLLDDYRERLAHQLRGFRAQSGGPAFLETWVPGEDDAESLEALVDAAREAGERDLALAFGEASLARVGRGPLEDLLRRRAALEIERETPELLVRLRLDATARAPGTTKRARAAAPRRAGAVPQSGPSPAAIAAYDAALAHVVVTHEGDVDPLPEATLVRASVGDARIAVCVARETHVIVAARHAGAPANLRPLLDLLCARIEHTPIRDAADHAAIRVEHELRGRGGPRAVAGVVSPDNADPRLRAAAELLRALGRAYCESTGSEFSARNEWEPPPRAEWAAMSDSARCARIQSALDEGAGTLGIAPGDLSCVRVEKTTRAILSLGEVDGRRKPAIVMEAERLLKDRIEPALGVWLEEVSDKNSIRRLVKLGGKRG